MITGVLRYDGRDHVASETITVEDVWPQEKFRTRTDSVGESVWRIPGAGQPRKLARLLGLDDVSSRNGFTFTVEAKSLFMTPARTWSACEL